MSELVEAAATLARLMEEIGRGEWTMSGQLSQISEKCLSWSIAYPEQFNAAYNRFEKARQAVRYEATPEEWEELRGAAIDLGIVFESVA